MALLRSNSSQPSEDTLKLRLVGGGGIPALVGRLLGDLAALPAWRCQVLEHGCQVGGQHAFEVRGHGVGPEEVMVEGVVAVDALGGIQHQQLVNEVQRVGVSHVGLQPVLHLPLLALDQLHLLKQLVLVHIWPHLGQGGRRGKRIRVSPAGYVAGPLVKYVFSDRIRLWFRTSLVIRWLRAACRCRAHGFDPRSGKIPHTMEQRSPCATTTEARV